VIRYLIDANSAVYAMDDGHEVLTARIADHAPGEIAISTISYAEVAYGTYVGKPPPPEILDAFVAAIPLLPFDEAAAREYARLPFKRARFDRLLAAHALSLGVTVITNNEGDFADVPGLTVENWTLP
jgi:tRNA(fMet)-specific endonuclease VapC